MVDEVILADAGEAVDLAPAEIVKEGNEHFLKKEIDLEKLIADQEEIVLSLQEQIDRANATISELKNAR